MVTGGKGDDRELGAKIFSARAGEEGGEGQQ